MRKTLAESNPGKAPAPPVLDDNVVAELMAIGGSDALFRRVVDLFLSKAPEGLRKIADERAATDIAALADAAHALKSMCSNIGARRAVLACHDLEHAARTRADFDAGEKIETITRELHEVMTKVKKLRAA